MNHQMELLGSFEPDRLSVAATGFDAPSFEGHEFNAAPAELHAGIPPLQQPSVVPHRLILIGISALLIALGATVVLMRLRPATNAAAAPTPSTAGTPDMPQMISQPHIFVAPKISLAKPSASSDPGSTIIPAIAPPASPGALSMPLVALTSPSPTGALPNSLTPADPAATDALMVDSPSPANPHSDSNSSSIKARRHFNQSLSLAAGSIIGCALETAIDSSRPGLVNCVVTDDVVSDDARTTLIERGSHVLGEYRSDARIGDTRIAIIWNRLRKSDGALVDLASPAVDAQGRSGIAGAVDDHWFSRIGAAVLLSVIEDGVAAATASSQHSGTVVLSNTSNTGTTLSQKILDASINQAPTIAIEAGARIIILVARDIDFSAVYATR